MAKEGDQVEKNPYKLSTAQRTAPNNKKKVGEWFEKRVALQREGVDQGFTPQLLFELPKGLKSRWLREVWNYHLSTLDFVERARIMTTTGPTKGNHQLGVRHG